MDENPEKCAEMGKDLIGGHISFISVEYLSWMYQHISATQPMLRRFSGCRETGTWAFSYVRPRASKQSVDGPAHKCDIYSHFGWKYVV